MDKSGSVAKAIVAAPTFDPVRLVEFGCEHVQEYINKGPEVAEKLTNSYVALNSLLSKPLETQTIKDSKELKKATVTTLRPTYLCLQCATICSDEDRDAHAKAKKHTWSIESRSGCLWCGRCDDFVYDPYFESLRVDQNFPTANGKRKKRKLSSVYPNGEEDKFVLPNSNALSCQAGAPRGVYNLGQTCYLSVILQAMVHNPIMRNYFLSSRHDTSECKIDNCIACALTASFTDIFATEKLDGHGPVEMLHKSWENANNLRGYSQQDAHEYFQSLLDHLHKTSDCAERKDSKKCQCLYHQIFYGRLRSTVMCLSCRNTTTTDEPIVDLALDLRNANKRRKPDPKESPVKGKQEQPPLELTQCLKDFTSPERLTDYKCPAENCNGGGSVRGRKHLTIKNLPATLCIVLKRFEHTNNSSIKVDTKLTFPMQLDMSPYTARVHAKKKKGLPTGMEPIDADPNSATPLSPRSPGWYDLSTVVVHMGKIDAGHYICYCKRDNQWFKFDDSKVTLATEVQVMNADAYLLFYIIRSLGPMQDTKEQKKREQNGHVDVDEEADDA